VSQTDQHPKADQDAASELHRIVERAQKGDRDVIPRLRQLLDDSPQLWQEASNLSAHTEAAWIDRIAGGNELLAEGLRRRISTMRAEYSGSNPTPIEMLLAERVVITWLQVQHADLTAAISDESSTQQARFLVKRLDAAQNRHLAAIRSMTTLQRLTRKPGRQPSAEQAT